MLSKIYTQTFVAKIEQKNRFEKSCSNIFKEKKDKKVKTLFEVDESIIIL